MVQHDIKNAEGTYLLENRQGELKTTFLSPTARTVRPHDTKGNEKKRLD